MNYLAHLLLGADTAPALLGSLLGDFVKGPLAAYQGPEEERASIALHRRIDSFADMQPDFRASRARVGPARRRVAGIMVDLFYDHFLALHWADYAQEDLGSFTGRVYRTLQTEAWRLPERLQRLVPYLVREDWLGSYRDPDQVSLALEGIGRRLSGPNLLRGGAEELLAHYSLFEADFRRFFPQAQAFAQSLGGRPNWQGPVAQNVRFFS